MPRSTVPHWGFQRLVDVAEKWDGQAGMLISEVLEQIVVVYSGLPLLLFRCCCWSSSSSSCCCCCCCCCCCGYCGWCRCCCSSHRRRCRRCSCSGSCSRLSSSCCHCSCSVPLWTALRGSRLKCHVLFFCPLLPSLCAVMIDIDGEQ